MSTSSKVCSKCQENKNLSEFHKCSGNKDGLDYNCKPCANKIIRDRRAKNGNKATFKYEKTLKGKVCRTYRNMLSRVRGVQKRKENLYLGLPIMNRNKFYEWSLNDKDYLNIHKAWTLSGYDRKLSPSIDRIDSSKGYVLDNIRWVTHLENSINISVRRNQFSECEQVMTEAYKKKHNIA